jgi:drug/metabolite transporter (DMT)-like permease
VSDREAQERLAFRRHLAISAMRLMGVFLFVGGLLLVTGRWEVLTDDTLNRIVGGAFMIAGLADFAIVPLILARSWKTPDGR